jgi:hypothetical protein
MCSEGASLALRFHPLGTLIGGPGLHNLLQPVEMKDVFRAAGDQTPAELRLSWGEPIRTRISAENRPVLPCGNLSGHQGKFWLGF